MHRGTVHLSLVRGPEGRRGTGGHLRAWRLRTVIGPVVQRGLNGLLLGWWCFVLVIPVGRPVRQRKTVAEPIQPGVPGVDVRIACTISDATPSVVRMMGRVPRGPVPWLEGLVARRRASK